MPRPNKIISSSKSFPSDLDEEIRLERLRARSQRFHPPGANSNRKAKRLWEIQKKQLLHRYRDIFEDAIIINQQQRRSTSTTTPILPILAPSTIVPLLGGIGTVGEYHVKLLLVNNSPNSNTDETVLVQIDTGSSNLLLAGQGCSSCQHEQTLVDWDPTRAMKCSIHDGCDTRMCDDEGDCGFRIRFGDGSKRYALRVEGKLVQVTAGLDHTHHGHHHFANVTARIMLTQDGNWPITVDGILGLASVRLTCNPTCDKITSWEEILGANSFTISLRDVGGTLSYPAYPPLTLTSVDSNNPLLLPPFQQQQQQPSSSSKSGLYYIPDTSDEVILPLLRSGGYYAVEVLGLALIYDEKKITKNNNLKQHKNVGSDEMESKYILLSPAHSDVDDFQDEHTTTNNNEGDTSTISISPYRVSIVDSGTTLFIVPPIVFDALKSVLQKYYCHLPGVCSRFGSPTIFQERVCLNIEPYHHFPDLILLTGNKGSEGIRIPPALYFVAYRRPDVFNNNNDDDETNVNDVGSTTLLKQQQQQTDNNPDDFVYCLGIQRGISRVMIVGDSVLRGYDTSFFKTAIRMKSTPHAHRKFVRGLELAPNDFIIKHIDPTRIIPFSPPVKEHDVISNVIAFIWLILLFLGFLWCLRQCLYCCVNYKGKRNGYDMLL
jgi:hypothetical protein